MEELATTLPEGLVSLVCALEYPPTEVFERAVSAGDIWALRWLAREYALTPADACADKNSALQAACADGRLAAAQWLTTIFDGLRKETN